VDPIILSVAFAVGVAVGFAVGYGVRERKSRMRRRRYAGRKEVGGMSALTRGLLEKCSSFGGSPKRNENENSAAAPAERILSGQPSDA
jgi:hypothetical protein